MLAIYLHYFYPLLVLERELAKSSPILRTTSESATFLFVWVLIANPFCTLVGQTSIATYCNSFSLASLHPLGRTLPPVPSI